MLWGALIGAVVALVIEGAAQAMRGKFEPGKLAKAVAIGALTGLVGGFITGALLKGTTATGARLLAQRTGAGIVGGGAAGATDQVANNVIDGRPVMEGVPRAIAIGGTVGGVAAPLAGPAQRVTRRAIDALRGRGGREAATGNAGRQVAQVVDDLHAPPELPPLPAPPPPLLPQPLKTPVVPPDPVPTGGQTGQAGRSRGLAQALGAEDGPPLNVSGAPVTVRVAPLANESVVVDSNIAIALRDRNAAHRALQEGERRMLERIEQLGMGDARLADRSVQEVQRGANQGFTANSFPLTTTRGSAEYTQLLERLRAANVGGAKGAADREIVADAFFAQTDPGVVPRFLSGDKSVYNRLASLAGIDPGKVGRPMAQAYPDGFRVTLEGRTIDVIPVR